MLDEKFEAIVRRYLPLMGPDDALDAQTPLREYGLDSMATVELIAELESAYGIRFVDDLLSLESFATPGTIWTNVSQLTGIHR